MKAAKRNKLLAVATQPMSKAINPPEDVAEELHGFNFAVSSEDEYYEAYKRLADKLEQRGSNIDFTVLWKNVSREGQLTIANVEFGSFCLTLNRIGWTVSQVCSHDGQSEYNIIPKESEQFHFNG